MSLDPEQLNALWQWTLTPEAVAECLVQDVFGARESGQKGPSEFYWIGRVPCRTVRLIGIVVGVQIYESRIAYSVDDGTGVIECQERPTRTKGETNELQASVSLGHTVVVVGRISPSRESRKILADSIARCRSPSEEPRHWLAVRDLHASHYSLDEPFVIPERPPPPSSTYTPSTPQHRTHTHAFRPQTQSTRSTFAPSSSPLQAPSSPQSQSSALQSPQKLRHPSKLRSRDLTGNTFRIYLKHYMYTAADRHPPSEPSTPTRSAPRPSPSSNSAEPRGFTVSYLRRVPSLALLAKQVAHAEWKRRALDEYNKAKAQGEHPSKPKPEKDPRKRRARTKRLFGWALQQMMKDGDVVSWEGERRGVDELEDGGDGDGSAIWRMDASMPSFSASTSTSTSINTSTDLSDGELSPPDETEEAFLPLTPSFIVSAVERAMKVLASRSAAMDVPAILRYLRRSDDMWCHLNSFAVDDALAVLGQQGSAWCVDTREGRWELAV